MPTQSALTLAQLSVGSMDNNVYIFTWPPTNESVIVDAANEASRILDAVKSTTVRYIIQTHGHADHVQALVELKRATQAPIAAHPADASILPVTPDILLNDGDRITLGPHDIEVLHTPGHTPGGICLLAGQVLISGDTLFPGGPGNTKSALGNFPQIIESVRRLFTLPASTRVYPGHGAPTTIGDEVPQLDEWIERGW
ncbi:MAG TPA: MBL fold metallo-hydrolase [Chloroflexota bacterium]|nr:MBL fold metallo-hydrolase [Chloroflexota bacterium]